MSTLEVSVPDKLKQFVETQAAAAGYASPGEYIAAILRQVQKRKAWDAMEKLVLEGMATPSRVMGPDDWQKLRDIIAEVESRSARS